METHKGNRGAALSEGAVVSDSTLTPGAAGAAMVSPVVQGDAAGVRHQADPLRRARLRWRARRGLLENDLILTRFLDHYERDLTDEDVSGLTALLDLTDTDLFDLLLEKSAPQGALATPDVERILALLRTA